MLNTIVGVLFGIVAGLFLGILPVIHEIIQVHKTMERLRKDKLLSEKAV